MSVSAADKGKGRALPEDEELEIAEEREEVSSSASDSASDSDSDSNSETSEDSESEDEITQEQLDALLEKARQNAVASSSSGGTISFNEEDIIDLGDNTDSTQACVHTVA